MLSQHKRACIVEVAFWPRLFLTWDVRCAGFVARPPQSPFTFLFKWSEDLLPQSRKPPAQLSQGNSDLTASLLLFANPLLKRKLLSYLFQFSLLTRQYGYFPVDRNKPVTGQSLTENSASQPQAAGVGLAYVGTSAAARAHSILDPRISRHCSRAHGQAISNRAGQQLALGAQPSRCGQVVLPNQRAITARRANARGQTAQVTQLSYLAHAINKASLAIVPFWFWRDRDVAGGFK